MLSTNKTIVRHTHVINEYVKVPTNNVISIIFTLWTKECSVLDQDSIEVVPESDQQRRL